MKRLLFGALLAVSCSSSTTPAVSPSSSGTAAPKAVKVRIAEPDLEIRQLVGPRDQNFPEGDMEVKLALRIGNRAEVPITLRRIEIQTVNPEGGAFSLTRASYYFKKTIEPNATGEAPFWARAVGYGRSTRDTEPVTIRGVIDYETPGGHYNQVFVRELSQYAGDH